MKLSSRNKAMLPGVIFLLLIAIFYMRFGIIILLLTIIPSIVAFLIDRREYKPAFRVIAACNLAAALPYIVPIIDLSLKKQYSDAGLVIDALTWAFIYCGAAAGWAMLFLAKYVARSITLMHYEYTISVLEKKQDLLTKEWGNEIIPIGKRPAATN